ncbi:MAG: hypothetical protein NZT61_05695 [Deltaproteobacteria bacterium]|nr:hypothetical protein [Deltaproteobacteria bacterium]
MEELAHFLLSLAVCDVGSGSEWVLDKVYWPVRKEFLNALVHRCRKRKFNSSCYKIFNTFFYHVSYCPTWREDPWSLLKLTESYLRLAFLEICEELAIYVSNKPWNSTISSDVELQKIVSVALNSLKKFDRNDQYGPSQALFRYLASIVNTLQTLRLKNFSKTEIACSISVLFLKSDLGRGLSLTTVSINIVGEFIRQLLQEIPEIATAILTDKYNLSQLLNLALYAIFGPFLDELSRNDAENGHSEDEIFEECKRQLSNCGFFECLKKVVLSIDAFSSEVHKGSNSGDNSVDACTLIERKLINLLKGFMLATECKSSQDQHQVLRRAFVSEFYLQYLSHNDCPYSEYSILWPNVVGLGCQLTSIVSRDDDFKSNFEKIVECLEKFLGTAFEQTLGRDQVELTLDWILQYLNLVITPERLELGSTVNVEEIVNELSKFIKARFEPGTFSLTPKDINPPQVYLAAINCGARFSSYFDSRKLYSLVEVYPPYGLESVFSEEETFECFILGQDSNARIVNLGSHDLSEIEKYLNPGGFEKANKRYEDWIRGMPENATFLEIFDRLIRHVSFKQGTQITAEHISHQKPEQNLADEQTRIITAALLRYFNDRLPHLVTGICHDRSPEAQQEIYSYLSSAEQVVSHSLEQLEQNRHLIPKDLQPSFETVVDTLNSLADHIQEQLRKCKTEASCTSKARFRLVPRKDPIDCWYGFLGDCCITDVYGNELSRSDFQPIRIMDDRGYIVGYVYVVIAEVEGRLSFVVAGIEPNYLIKTRIDYGSFVEGLLGGLVRLSKRVKVDGRAVEGVYVNAGYKGERDDGRISQLSQVRDAIRKLGKEYLRELDRPVQFPYTYSKPISYVYDISSVGIIANLANSVE